ncbi:hypothetical protein BS47DRAFT_1363021 [Hydnum rufescens UP504]|uniref:Wax synthase domain-containing protein n=1 Tax=Hydnum rufescens UP504 TaxID=1448309 RepID=A0A9P6DWC4_9AGAM|nr:hypothetical protein BS47DRAFT_1363021 [Hydnum rufescens UP504]
MDRKPFSLLPVVTAEVLLIIALTFPQVLFRRTLFFPVIAYFYLYNVVWCTTASDLILLDSFNSPKLRDSEVANKISPIDLPVWKRVTRSIELLWNPRGVGWNFRLPEAVMPAQAYASRGPFIRTRILRLIVLYLLFDAKEAVQHLTPEFQNVMAAEPGTPSLVEQDYGVRFMIVLGWVVAGFAVLDAQHVALSLVSVSLGMSEPKDWPNMMGDVRTLVVSGRRGGIRPASSLDKAIKFSVAFAISAIIHGVGGGYMVANNVMLSVPFFLSQPLGIALESLVTHLFGDLLSSKWTWLKRIVGYVWVAIWFTLTLAGNVDDLIRAGTGGAEILPFSVWRGIGIGKWSTSSRGGDSHGSIVMQLLSFAKS